MKIQFLALAIILSVSTASAEEYERIRTRLVCSVDGTRQSIGEKKTGLKRSLMLGFAAQAVQGSTTVLTPKFTDVTTWLISDFAQEETEVQKFSSGQRPTEIKYETRCGTKCFPALSDLMSVNLVYQGKSIVAEYDLNLNMTLSNYAKLLELMGENSHPNFEMEKPMIDWSGSIHEHGNVEFTGQSRGRGGNESSFRIKYIETFQLHYGESQYDGLSYHIEIKCE